jgi:hypothetical protein
MIVVRSRQTEYPCRVDRKRCRIHGLERIIDIVKVNADEYACSALKLGSRTVP